MKNLYFGKNKEGDEFRIGYFKTDFAIGLVITWFIFANGVRMWRDLLLCFGKRVIGLKYKLK